MVHGTKLGSMQGTKQCAAQTQNSAIQQCNGAQQCGAQHKWHKTVDLCTVYSNVQHKIEQGAQNTTQHKIEHRTKYHTAQNRAHGTHVLLSCRAASTGNQEGDRELSSGTTQSINGSKPCILPQRCNIKIIGAHFEAEKWLKGVCVKNS